METPYRQSLIAIHMNVHTQSRCGIDFARLHSALFPAAYRRTCRSALIILLVAQSNDNEIWTIFSLQICIRATTKKTKKYSYSKLRFTSIEMIKIHNRHHIDFVNWIAPTNHTRITKRELLEEAITKWYVFEMHFCCSVQFRWPEVATE